MFLDNNSSSPWVFVLGFFFFFFFFGIVKVDIGSLLVLLHLLLTTSSVAHYTESPSRFIVPMACALSLSMFIYQISPLGMGMGIMLLTFKAYVVCST